MEFSDSLKKNSDFQKVYKRGSSLANRYLVMYKLENGTSQNRIGISVSKRVGNSVVRHHLTRLVRESYRLNEFGFRRGFDIVIILRMTAKGVGYKQIESALLHISGLHHIYSKKKEE